MARGGDLVAGARANAAAEVAVRGELDRIEASLDATKANLTLLLALAILRDGHAKNLGEALEIAEDLDRVRGLYPEIDA